MPLDGSVHQRTDAIRRLFDVVRHDRNILHLPIRLGPEPPAIEVKEFSSREALDVIEESAASKRISEIKVFRKCLPTHRPLDMARREHRLHLGGKDNASVELMVIERFDSKTIADEAKALLLIIPHCA